MVPFMYTCVNRILYHVLKSTRKLISLYLFLFSTFTPDSSYNYNYETYAHSCMTNHLDNNVLCLPVIR